MRETRDPVDGVLRSLAEQNWTPGQHENQLEETLMQEFDRAGRSVRRVSHRALWIGGLVLLVGGAGFAATGGREAVKKLMVRVHWVGSDASVFEGAIDPIPRTGEYQQQIALDDGRLAGLHVRVLDQPGSEGMKQVTVQIPEGDGAAPAESSTAKTLQVSLGDAAANAERIVVDEIAEPERTLEWADSNGETHILYLVRDADGDVAGAGFTLFRAQDDGTFLQLGDVRTPVGKRVEVEDVEIDDNGLVSLTLRSPNGELTNVSLFVASE